MKWVHVGTDGHLSLGEDTHVRFILFETLMLSLKHLLLIKYGIKRYYLNMDDVFNYQTVSDR